MSIHVVDKNLHIENVAVQYRDHPQGSESKLNTHSDGLKVIRTVLFLFRDQRPFTFFKLIALVLAQLAVDFYIPVFSEYMRTGIVPNFPTRIAYGFTMVAAIHSLFSGFTLETLWQKARQDFEMLLRRVIDRHRHLHLS